jgi:hypothetical protein
MRAFEYHRSVAPMMWALVCLATIEGLAVHLLLSLRWPWLAWPLSLVSAGAVGWMVVLIRSFERLPHTLSRDMLTLRAGRLRSVVVQRSDIAGISDQWEPGAHRESDTLNLALIAHPKRIVDLKTPRIGKRGLVRRIAIALDDPAAFDTALGA